MKNKNYELPATSYIPVIGLEVHVELKTKSKMFCGCSAEYFGKEPNTHCCPICLGLPGTLPVPNKKAIGWCVMIGLALNCKIPLFSKFDRKNYFYPDLPKGYQISQYDQPFCINGWIQISTSDVILGRSETTTPESPTSKVLRDSGRAPSGRTVWHIPSSLARMTKKRIRIRRVHMEEDTAKLVHQSKVQSSKFNPSTPLRARVQSYEGYSLIDFNRSGVPLVEIVTEPDFESATEVVEYLKKIQQIVRYLDVSDADMEKGEMRLEPNVSLKPVILASGARPESPSKVRDAGQASMTKEGLPNYKVEVKNINSFQFVGKAINYEIERQKIILEAGKVPKQETRGWDEKKQVTVTQRVKEEAMDYRYFPEPDIPPVRWRKFQISNFKSQMPELPDQKFNRFQKEYGLSAYNSDILTRERSIADYFEEAVKVNHELSIRRPELMPKGIKNQESIITKVIANWIINKKVDLEKTMPAKLVQSIITSTQKTTVDQKYLEKTVKQVILDNPKAISDYKKGKAAVIGFLIGQVKQVIKKPIDTTQIKEAIEKLLEIN